MKQNGRADMQIIFDAKHCGYYLEAWQRKMINGIPDGIHFLYI